MTEQIEVQVLTEPTVSYRVPVDVPTPTIQYRSHRKMLKTIAQPGAPVPASPVPAAAPLSAEAFPGPNPVPIQLTGPRVLMWKQDPTVGEIGIRKSYLPGYVRTGPKDARIAIQGLAPVNANAFGDFVQTPGTDEFDAVHTFAVVRQTLTMYQRALAAVGNPIPWQWNSAANTDPLSVFPHGIPNTMNAFYSRSQKALKFGDFLPPASPGVPAPPRAFTCRSFDIVAHETGHAILDGLKPGWLGAGNLPQTGGLHESFGDLSAIFLALSQLDQVEAVIAQTKANLHDKTFLADLAEEFGLALGRPNGLRNADNNLKLSQTGNEVHAISQVFTGGVYDVLASIFAFERNPSRRDDAYVLLEVAQYVCSLVFRAIVASPSVGATYANVVNNMLTISVTDGKPAQYRTFIRDHFTLREVVVASIPVAFGEAFSEGIELEPGVTDGPNAVQDRRTSCGTMQLDEYMGGEEWMEAELAQLTTFFANGNGQVHKNGRAQESVGNR